MSLIKDLKLKLRISHDMLNMDIQDNADTCVLDLINHGVSETKASIYTEDKLIIKCIELYCKAEFDYMNKGEQFRDAYEKLRDSLSLCQFYLDGDDENVQ